MFPIHYRFCFAGLVALLSGGGAAVGQSFDAYQLLRCHAPIPEEFTTSSTEKVLRDDARVTGSDNDRKAKKEFFLENNFVIDDLLQSGRVLFNDSVSAYVNKVADRLLAKKPELRKQLRFYAVKYPSVNAFATDRGTVFVNVGLVAHLQNEAQLAFVLAHEIIHFQKRHAVNAYVRFKRIEADGRGFRSDYYKSLLERSQYSQAIETEADREGMELFASSGYAPQAGIDAFDMMARAHLPYEDRPFDKAFLETPLLKIPKKLLLTETQAIKEDRDADTLSTHPATKIRKALAVKRLGKESGAGKVLYLVSEAEFTKVRDLARFETLNAYLHSRDYEAALYHTYLLSCDYPHSQYLTAARARALYGLAQYVANDRREEVLEDYTELQGQQQQLYAILYKLSKAELATLAARACWDAYRAYPKDDAAWQMCKDMVEDIPIFILDKPEEYYRKNAQDTAGVHAGSFARTAFIDIWTNKEFQGMLASGAKFKKQLNELTNATSKGKHSHHRSSSANSEYSEGTALGIRSALVINPTYMAADIATVAL